ncbi:nicotinate-nucleotide--dimethylbenzimidazole phosphoribosyltransferase [Epibacterium ulvae]|uniref:nicotinate-nucleotide--dimethylbenzimidazole phosphoribosyltransferase n=1 Tax=Epibacterium ulvae TaxID=1156985 RepID=UPI001BFC3F93|nr:nicotinate-nucleotide--dimethylbenzimidazole phosphoribosyltransferase [Epibacterium ulvae]MBT8154214.1 nicotinate-nucleotide--dimethylbenzimidazole phosphoribosyltransferase [Epibacterium ulvae]
MLPQLTSLTKFKALLAAAPGINSDIEVAAAVLNGQLTKPPGSLGRLEDLAIWYASWRGNLRPQLHMPQVIVFAGNHGVAKRGVSAFPAEVTEQMVQNFERGGAAINQLARLVAAQLDVVALQLDRPTQDFTQDTAMSEEEVLASLAVGWEAVDPAADLLVVGEMGIGNTTAAAALCHALFGGTASDWTGRGTGVDNDGLASKARIVEDGVAAHKDQINDGLDALTRLGGREIAGMVGAIAAARMLRIPVILDGFICCAAAACLAETVEGALDHTVAGHVSAESAHQALLDRIGKVPLLSLDMRLGEGSGGTLAIQVLRGALACHSGMATFDEAGVSDG